MHKVAIIGSRGIPAKYGGFETFAEGLSTKLAKKGYDIVVTCEYEPRESRIPEFNGVKLEYFPLKPPKSYFLRKFYENISDIYFLLKLSRNVDLIYFLGIEVGMFLFIPKMLKRKIKVLVNIDGVMWKRDKFNRIEKLLLKLNHDLATVFADTIIADAEEMKKYVKDGYREKTVYISYGINEIPQISWEKENLMKIEDNSEDKTLKNVKSVNADIFQYGISIPTKIRFKNKFKSINSLNKGRYWLVVARLEPENNIEIIVDAYSRANTRFPLVIVGDFTSDNYKKKIYEIASNNENILFLGAIYDLNILDMLRQNCFAYIHGHTVGGTNPSLLEAMIMKNIIIAHNNGFNQEVCGKCALYFANSEELKYRIQLIEKESPKFTILKKEAYNRVKSKYSWDKIVDEYDVLFKKELNTN